MYRLKILSVLLFVILCSDISAQYDIKIKVDNYDNDTLIIGYNMGAKTLARDTLMAKKKGEFHLMGKDTLEPGVYMALTRPDNNFTQFFVNEMDKEFSLRWDAEDLDKVSFKGSKDNEIFKEYIDFLSKKRELLATIDEEKNKAKEEGKDTLVYQQRIEDLDGQVVKRQLEIINQYPNTITSLFLKSSQSFDIPEFEGTAEEVQQKKYEYYKSHYFDNIELANPASLRTPFLDKRVMYYVDNLTHQIPDSLYKSIDYLLKEMEPAPDSYRYYLSHFLNTYANKRIIGMDAVYVYLVDNYYNKGKAPWVTDEVMEEITRTANNMRGALIGKTFPDITTFTVDKEPVRIRSIKSPYKVIVFWKSTCSHCKKSMPDLVKFQEDFADQGVKVITICTMTQQKTSKCMEYAKEHDMGALLNTFDEKGGFMRKIYVNSTPKIFILDENNEILLKDLGPDKLAEVMPQIIAIEKE